MRNISIDISERLEELLTQFHHTDTMATNRPIFIVRDILDHCENCDPECDGERCMEHVNRSFHFSWEEAKKYLTYQGHNLSDPYIFGHSPGYANGGDYIPFYDLLKSIAEKLERR